MTLYSDSLSEWLISLWHVNDEGGGRWLVLEIHSFAFRRDEHPLQFGPKPSAGVLVTVVDRLEFAARFLHVLGHDDLTAPVGQVRRASTLHVRNETFVQLGNATAGGLNALLFCHWRVLIDLMVKLSGKAVHTAVDLVSIYGVLCAYNMLQERPSSGRIHAAIVEIFLRNLVDRIEDSPCHRIRTWMNQTGYEIASDSVWKTFVVLTGFNIVADTIKRFLRLAVNQIKINRIKWLGFISSRLANSQLLITY